MKLSNHSVVQCNVVSEPMLGFGFSITKTARDESGKRIPDTYLCLHCKSEFQGKCIHGIAP
jgi:hypothetical protein